MSVLSAGERRFAAGLYWMERGGAATVARNARAFGRPWYVHWSGQTGYAADEESPKDCPSLAASLQAHIALPSWMALVEADDGRLALVKARDGSILADGDEVFPDRASALEAFERARGVPGSSSVGWSLHATPGLVEGEVTEIDPASLTDDPAMRLVAAPLSMLGLPKAGRFLALAVMVAGAGFVWTQRETLWTLIAGPDRVDETEQESVEPPVTAALDAGTLIAGCRQALMVHPPYMPAWRTERVSCEGRFADFPLIAVRPELEDRAVLTVRWRLESGRPEPLHRRIAETHLSRWYTASVTGDRAWAAMPLPPVLRLSDDSSPSLLEFRKAVDRRFGMAGTRIEYPVQDADGIEVRIATGRVPFGLANAVAAVPGLELVRLTRDGAGRWLLEGRRVSPVSMPRERFEQLAKLEGSPLTQSVTQPPTASTAKPEGSSTDSVSDSVSDPIGGAVANGTDTAATGTIGGAPAGTTGDAAGAALSRTDNHEDPGT